MYGKCMGFYLKTVKTLNVPWYWTKSAKSELSMFKILYDPQTHANLWKTFNKTILQYNMHMSLFNLENCNLCIDKTWKMPGILYNLTSENPDIEYPAIYHILLKITDPWNMLFVISSHEYILTYAKKQQFYLACLLKRKLTTKFLNFWQKGLFFPPKWWNCKTFVCPLISTLVSMICKV